MAFCDDGGGWFSATKAAVYEKNRGKSDGLFGGFGKRLYFCAMKVLLGLSLGRLLFASTPVLTDEGDLVFAWWLLAVVAVLFLAALGYRIYKRYSNNSIGKHNPDAPNTIATAQPPSLLPQITQLMEERQLFLRSDLKLSDVAGELGASRSAVTNSIRTACGCTFPNFVNTYRVDYVKKLMLSNPESKICSLYLEAGFANETSFFRTFKELTGMTPTEWRVANQPLS